MNYKTIKCFYFYPKFLQITGDFELKMACYLIIRMRFIQACLCFEYAYHIVIKSLYLLLDVLVIDHYHSSWFIHILFFRFKFIVGFIYLFFFQVVYALPLIFLSYFVEFIRFYFAFFMNFQLMNFVIMRNLNCSKNTNFLSFKISALYK